MNDVATTRDSIARYFDETVSYYRLFWHRDTGALHFGMRDSGTRRHREELLRANQVLADAAGVRADERVLDAGCGVGGSAIWLVRERGARVLGVTLSAEQARRATEAARRSGVSDRAEFRVEDYTNTSLPDESIDVFWAHESACYAADKRAFLSEAVRVLRPNGRIVVADGFAYRAPGFAERWLRTAFERGLALPPLERVSEFTAAMDSCGLSLGRMESRLRDVTPSCRRLFWLCLLSYPLALLGFACRLVSRRLLANSRSGICLYLMVRLGLVDYCLIVGVKQQSARDSG